MNLQNRIDLMVLLGEYLKKNTPEWQAVKSEATAKNPWFTEKFINQATDAVVTQFLNRALLEQWTAHYHLDNLIADKNVGIVMAGNIPMVGFHDFLCVFISGHRQTIKLSSKDDALLAHLINELYKWNDEVKNYITFAEQLKGCDAYIATGGNQSAPYFEQYFSKYPNIIRKNRTSVAILTGNETYDELLELSRDIHLYFGLGCRNVTKIFISKNYDFIPLLKSFEAFKDFRDHHKYSNNYDYQLSILLLNNVKYMTNESTLLIEDKRIFSAISILHYEYYENRDTLEAELKKDEQIQCIISKADIPFGKAQQPDLFSYADGKDTIQFLLTL